MKNFTRILALVLAAAFVASMAIVGVSAASTAGTWYTAAVEYLDDAGISSIGSTAGEPVTRDEFVTWVAKIESRQTIETAWTSWEYTANMTFNDVSESDHLGAIGYSVNRKFIVGNGDVDADGKTSFTPSATTKLAEASAVIVRMMGYSSLVKADENWAVNNMNVAQRYLNLFDSTFLSETGTYDPDYKLTKGEAAYLLYTIMNGKIHDGTNPYGNYVYTVEDIDLGEYFANLDTATVSYKVMVTELAYAYSRAEASGIATASTVTQYSTGRTWRRLDAQAVGSEYGVVNAYARTTGWFATSASSSVVLTSVDGKALTPAGDTSITITGAEFYNLVNIAIGNWANGAVKSSSVNIANYVNKGSVLTLKVAKANTGDVTYASVKSVEIADSLIMDLTIRFTTTNSDLWYGFLYVNKGTASNTNMARSTDVYTWKDVTATKGTLTVNGVDYNVVTSATGNKNDLLIYTLDGVTTTAKTVSVVGDKGDRVFAGAEFEDLQYDALIAADASYATYFTAGTHKVKTTFALKENIYGRVAYTMTTNAGLAQSSALCLKSSFFDAEGKYLTTVDQTPLTAAQAQKIMLDRNLGETVTVFTDIDKDGYYDTAVVIEAESFMFYQDVNYSLDPGNGYIGNTTSSEIYDAQGNYVTTSYGTKGVNVGGFSIGMNIVTGQYTFGTGGNTTDIWKVEGTNNKIQLVYNPSNSRFGYGIPSFQTIYASGALPGYKVIDVATLTTGYITKVNTATKTVGGQVCYEATVATTDGTTAVVYIPVSPKEELDVTVTLDGYTSTIKTHSGKQFLSFVTDHVTDDSIGDTANLSGSWMAGHTVKYTVDANNVAWAMVETATADAVEGFVTSITKSATGDNTYTVSLATTKDNSESAVYVNGTTQALAAANWYFDNESGSTPLAGYGAYALTNPTAQVEVYVYNGSQNMKNVVRSCAKSQDQGMFEAVTGLGIGGYAAAPLAYYHSWANVTIPAGAVISKTAYNAYVLPQYAADFTKVTVSAYQLWTAANLNKEVYIFDVGTVVNQDVTIYQFNTGDVEHNIRSGLANVTKAYAAGDTVTVPGYVVKGTTVYTEAIDTTLDVQWLSAYYYVTMAQNAATATDALSTNDYATAKIVPSTGASYTTLQDAYDALATSDYVNPTIFVYHRTYATRTIDYIKTTTAVNTTKTVTVRGSGTAVWTYDADTYAFVHDLFTEQKLYNTDTWSTSGKVTASDLLYVTLGTDASGYYTVEGKDAKAYAAWTNIGAYNNYQQMVVETGANNAINWRTALSWISVIIPANYKQGAATTWTVGTDTKALGATIIDGSYTKTSAAKTELSGGNGYTDTFKMAVGENPYYLRTVAANGKVTIEKYYETVTIYENVIGTKYYQIDKSKTIVIELYTAESDGTAKKQVVDDGVSYTDNSKYWVDSTGLVYRIDATSGVVYDKTKTTSENYVYDTASATVLSSYTDVKMGATVGGVVCGSQDGYAVATFVNMPESATGYVPTMVNVAITTNLGASDAFTMMGSSPIVIATPTDDGFTYVTTTAKALAEAGTTLFVASYNRTAGSNATFVTIIGEAYQSTVTPVTPVGKETTVTGGTLVFLPANVGFNAGIDQLANYWVVRSTGSAINVVTGEEVGSIQMTYNTYVEKNQTVAGGSLAASENGSFYLVNDANDIIMSVNFATAGVTTSADGKASVTVKTATITACTADGTLTAVDANGKAVDFTGKTFKFFYATADGNTAALGGSSTKVTVYTMAQIKASYASYATIAADTTKSAEDRAEAAAKVAEIKAAATGSYLNGTFWGVEYSPLYNYFQTNLITYQSASAKLTFNYVVVDDVVYVYVNSFAY